MAAVRTAMMQNGGPMHGRMMGPGMMFGGGMHQRMMREPN